jgi:CBS domain-containing protein
MTSKPTPKSDAKAKGTPAAVAERWAAITARDILQSEVITIPYATPLSEVERILSDNRISGAPVTDETGHIVGIISVRDLVERYTEDPDARPRRGQGFYHLSTEEMLEEDFDSFEVPEESEETAEDVMSAEIYSVPAHAGLVEIAALMAKHNIHRVLVAEEGRHVGLITTTEVLKALAG